MPSTTMHPGETVIKPVALPDTSVFNFTSGVQGAVAQNIVPDITTEVTKQPLVCPPDITQEQAEELQKCGITYRPTEEGYYDINFGLMPNPLSKYNPFPEGVEGPQLPDVVKESWKKVQEHLSPEKQSQISYYLNNEGQWCMKMGNIANIHMENVFTEDNPDVGIDTINGNSYFNMGAASSLRRREKGSFPTNDLWGKIARFLGGFTQLREILQIPLVGWYSPDDDDALLFVGEKAALWSTQDSSLTLGLTYVRLDSRNSELDGYSIRLLDKGV